MISFTCDIYNNSMKKCNGSKEVYLYPLDFKSVSGTETKRNHLSSWEEKIGKKQWKARVKGFKYISGVKEW